jgi:hypothetical protein
MSEWQPIETAPRDGTHVLLYIPYTDRPLIVVGYQEKLPDHIADMQMEWSWKCAEAGAWAEDDSYAGQPTHWMPLPDSPSAVSEVRK